MADVRRLKVGTYEIFGPGVLVAPVQASGDATSAFPFTIAQFEVAPGASSGSGSHGANEIWHVLRGAGRLVTESVVIALQAGDIVHLDPDAPHVIENPGDAAFVALSLTWPVSAAG